VHRGQQRHHAQALRSDDYYGRWPKPPQAGPAADVPLKDPKEWKIIGKPVKRLDTMTKVTGAQVYGFDLKLPGMLNAAIKECPVFGGKVKSFEAAKAQGMPA